MIRILSSKAACLLLLVTAVSAYTPIPAANCTVCRKNETGFDYLTWYSETGDGCMYGSASSLPDSECLDLGGRLLTVVNPTTDFAFMSFCPSVPDCTALSSCTACTTAQCLWSEETQTCIRVGTKVAGNKTTQRVCQGTHPAGGCGAVTPEQCSRATHQACDSLTDCEACGGVSQCGWCALSNKCITRRQYGTCLGNCPYGCMASNGDSYTCPTAPVTQPQCEALSCKDCTQKSGCGWCEGTGSCMLAGTQSNAGYTSPCNGTCPQYLKTDPQYCPNVPDCSVFDDDCAGCRQANCQLCVPDVAEGLAGRGKCRPQGDQSAVCTTTAGIVVAPSSTAVCPLRNCSVLQNDCASCTAAGCEFCSITGACYPQYVDTIRDGDDLCGDEYSSTCSIDTGSQHVSAATCPPKGVVCEQIPRGDCKTCLDSNCGFCAQSGRCYSMQSQDSYLPKTCQSDQCNTFDSSFSTDDVTDQLYVGDSGICPEQPVGQTIIITSLVLGLLIFCCGAGWVLKPTSNPQPDTTHLLSAAA